MQIFENADCMEGMKQYPDKYFDIAIVDPPYFSGPERREYYGRKRSPIGVQRFYEDVYKRQVIQFFALAGYFIPEHRTCTIVNPEPRTGLFYK